MSILITIAALLLATNFSLQAVQVPTQQHNGYLDPNIKNIGDYRIEDHLWKDDSGQNVKVKKDTERRKTLKVSRDDPKSRKDYDMEIRKLKEIGRRLPIGESFCAKMLFHFNYNGHTCIGFQELSTSTYEFMRTNYNTGYPMDQLKIMAYQVIVAAIELHDAEIIHTEINSKNVCHVKSSLSKDEKVSKTSIFGGKPVRKLAKPDVRLTNLNSVVFVRKGMPSKYIPDNHIRPCAAPEVKDGYEWDYTAIIWSIGCTMLEWYTGSPLPLIDGHSTPKFPPKFVQNIKNKIMPSQSSNTEKKTSMVGTPPSETIKFGNKKIEDYMRKSPDADTILLFKLLPQMLTYEANKRIQLRKAFDDTFFDSVRDPKHASKTHTEDDFDAMYPYKAETTLNENEFIKTSIGRDMSMIPPREMVIFIVSKEEPYKTKASIEIGKLQLITDRGFENNKNIFKKVYDNFDLDGHQCSVIEKLGTTLHHFMQNNNKGLPLPLNQIVHVGRQLIEAFIFLQKDVGIFYANVKTSDLNLLMNTQCTRVISEEYASSLKVLSKRFPPELIPSIEQWINDKQVRELTNADVRLDVKTCSMQTGNDKNLVVKSLEYSAPEVLSDDATSEAAVVWNIGAIMFELYTGHPYVKIEGQDKTIALQLFGVQEFLSTNTNEIVIPPSMLQNFLKHNPRLTLTGHNRLRYDTSNIENFHIKPLDEYFIGAKREGTYMEKYAYQLHDLLRKTFECDPEKRIKMDDMLKHEYFIANEPVSPKNADKPPIHSDSASVLSGKTLVNVKGGKKLISDDVSKPSKEDVYSDDNALFYGDGVDDDQSDILSIKKPKGVKNTGSKPGFTSILSSTFKHINIHI